MDSFPPPSEDVLNELDPLSRALLDLSVQRGMDDAEIAQVLGTDESSVNEVRVGLLRNLAERVAPEQAEAELPELEAAVAAQLYPEVADEEAAPGGETAVEAEAEDETAVEADELGDEVDEAELEETAVEAEPEAEAEPEPEPAQPEAEPEPVATTADAAPAERKRSPLVVLLPILLLIAVVALIVVLAGGGDDETDQPAAGQTQPDRPAEDGRQPAPLEAMGSSEVTGTASLTGDRLMLDLEGLPDAQGGTYTAWLYDNVIDAKRIGTVKDGKLDAKLPGDADDYEFVDVSLEPDDGNPNHSGESVVRVELRKLAN